MLKDMKDGEQIIEYLNLNKYVLGWEEDPQPDDIEDCIYNADILVSVYNDHKALYKLLSIKNIMEYKYSIYVHLVYEQIGDQMLLQDSPYLTADFYIFDDKEKYSEMIL